MRERLIELARGALIAIEGNRRRIDDLNVYPVPDGDTGTNLALSVRAVVETLESSRTEIGPISPVRCSRGALMGARGNSGVILSQIIRGAAESLATPTTCAGPFAARATPPIAPCARPSRGRC